MITAIRRWLRQPPFAAAPPVPVPMDAISVGRLLLAVAALAAVGNLIVLVEIAGAIPHPQALGGPLSLLITLGGVALGFVADALLIRGGRRMSKGSEEGKGPAIDGLAVALAAYVILGLGIAAPVTILVYLVLVASTYYVVVASQVPVSAVAALQAPAPPAARPPLARPDSGLVPTRSGAGAVPPPPSASARPARWVRPPGPTGPPPPPSLPQG
ncbi:MAG TPA: hypothetical protein VMW49_02175 [Candidatus Dormibacteraeota bacterium]|nr:hypothetical protein [Candidatus Dormibacteraeota bacterium]